MKTSDSPRIIMSGNITLHLPPGADDWRKGNQWTEPQKAWLAAQGSEPMEINRIKPIIAETDQDC